MIAHAHGRFTVTFNMHTWTFTTIGGAIGWLQTLKAWGWF